MVASSLTAPPAKATLSVVGTRIPTKYLGTQNLVIGQAVNYASRITAAGKGNRCLVGPMAVEHGLSHYNLRGPFEVKGKKGEGAYMYYELDLDDIWEAD